MSYIGKEPADSFISFAKQDFSTSATTSYTLDNAVANENELALFINFVRQEPTTAYTASGTTLTLTSATTSSDDMYCVYLGQAKQTVNAPDGSVGSSQVAASIITGQTAETSIATDDTVLIHDTSAGALRKMTRANFVSGIGGTNTPYFSAYLSSTQSGLNDDAITKINLNAEYADSDNAFDSTTNYRFTVPTGEGGEYFLTAKFNGSTQADQDNKDTQVYIYKNGSSLARGRGLLTDSSSDVTQVEANASIITTLAAGDYIEMYGRVNSSGNNNNNQAIANGFTVLSGYKLIE